jgi:hypothetical protein
MSTTLNDTVLRIHMTYLSNKESVEWIASFENEIAHLDMAEFQNLVNMLEGVSGEEQANFDETIMNNEIPMHLQNRAAGSNNFSALIEQLKIEYSRWNS